MSLEKLREARVEFGAHNFDRSFDLFQELLQENPMSPYLLERLGVLSLLSFENRGDGIEGAEAYFLSAHKIAPWDAQVIWQLAHLYDVILPNPEERRRFANLLKTCISDLQEGLDELLSGSD